VQESLLAGGPEAGPSVPEAGPSVPEAGHSVPEAGHNGSNVAEAGPNSEDEETEGHADGHVTHGPASGALSERLWRTGARRLVQVTLQSYTWIRITAIIA